MGTISKAMSKLMPRDLSMGSENAEVLEESKNVEIKKSPISPVNDSIFKATGGSDGNIESWDERLLEVTTNSPLVSEGIRRLRNKIMHPEGNTTIKSVLVTSALPGEGKSFICANLAISVAQGVEKHAIMVDCDLRRPSLAGIFGVDNNRGLVNYLYDNSDLSELIKQTGQEKLAIIPSGPPPVNPAEIVDSQRMESLIDELATRYDDRLLIVDSPPVLAAAETVVLAKQVDGVILVVRWGKAGREQVKEIVETIGKKKIIGIVFNAFELNKVEKHLQKMKGYDGYYKYATGY